MHDLASADSRDIPRSACFESKAPTALTFLLLNLPGLQGYAAPGGSPGTQQARRGAAALHSWSALSLLPQLWSAQRPASSCRCLTLPTKTIHRCFCSCCRPPIPSLQPSLAPIMAVGTSGGATYLVSPDTMTVFAKLR
jgi:hypothetical protein